MNFGKLSSATIEVNGWGKGLKYAHKFFCVFTDGSKVIVGGKGTSAYCAELEIRKSYKLPNYCRIFLAELFPIKLMAELLYYCWLSKKGQ